MVIYEVYSELLGIYYIGQKKSNHFKSTYYGNSVLHDMLKSESPYSPFHKNNKKLQKLSGMILKFNILKDEITFNSKS